MSDGHNDGDTTVTWSGYYLTKQDTEVAAPHYVKSPTPLEVIEAWNLDFIEGNVLKYLARWRTKGGVDDLRKLADYASRLLIREQAKE